ncbi:MULTISPECIES: histidine phosphatase family protein [Pseudomonas]|nr:MULTISPECIES: histidine phosphatase family protein [Pseudomonas]MBI6673884.1 histidine phosphatase family protein [Pseudomonas syringae]MDP5166281.1 histidine phosphatase family protein [Pseudomonas syringae pv. aptata str. DSM 50252]NAO54531.1 histidine phosphatase family protein [Pseudomonas syringae]PYD26184.1 histidine phosphatase family protein [Pseudomonas syringae pv. pisi]QVK34909.1 histidine phosphatase family protein [Pseudomonas syringae]
MKLVRLIGRGESTANAGAPTQDHASIPLTEHGVDQARRVALLFAKAPYLIVTSPFSRSMTTAQFMASAFPAVPLETWPIQEFTSLEPARYVNTTVAQRRDWVKEYWNQANPSFLEGDGSESFIEFVSRAQSFLERLEAHPAKDIVVFSHGQFINAVAGFVERQPTEIDSRIMTDWREYEIAYHVANCDGCRLVRDQGNFGWRLMPKNAKGAALRARLS